jgi:hypothetical protein
VDPVDTALGRATRSAHGIDDGVEAVADDSIDTVNARVNELGDELVRNGFSHGLS